MSQFVHNDDDNKNDEAKAIAILRVFSENSRADKNNLMMATNNKRNGPEY